MFEQEINGAEKIQRYHLQCEWLLSEENPMGVYFRETLRGRFASRKTILVGDTNALCSSDRTEMQAQFRSKQTLLRTFVSSFICCQEKQMLLFKRQLFIST